MPTSMEDIVKALGMSEAEIAKALGTRDRYEAAKIRDADFKAEIDKQRAAMEAQAAAAARAERVVERAWELFTISFKASGARDLPPHVSALIQDSLRVADLFEVEVAAHFGKVVE